jgi:uncharacterized membrane protein YidH (DUF202 family)
LRALAFAIGLFIAAVGAVGAAAPAVLFWIAQRFVDSGAPAFFAVAAVRIAFGLILISAAPASRAPRALRVLGYVIVAAGVTTAVTAVAGIDWGRGAIEEWMRRGAGVARLTAIPLLALGSFVAYTCAPARRDSH